VGTPGKYEADSVWTSTFTATNGDAWPDVQKTNQFNTAPPAGSSDVIGTMTVAVGASAASTGVDPGQSLVVDYVGSDGNSYAAINHPCGVLPSTELQDAGVMFPNASRSVLVCAQVPTTAVHGGTWSVGYFDGSTPAAFFKGA
jgi:hypothetical protein